MKSNGWSAVTAVALLLALTIPGEAAAQWSTPPRFQASESEAAVRSTVPPPAFAVVPSPNRVGVMPSDTAQASTSLLAIAGVAGGGLGALAGGLLAVPILEEFYLRAGLGGVIMGATVGFSLGIPLAVHLAAAEPRGSYLLAALASGGIAAAMIASGMEENPGMIIVPTAQIVSSILIERATD